MGSEAVSSSAKLVRFARAVLVAGLIGAAVIAGTGCGGGEDAGTYNAEGFVAAANQYNADLAITTALDSEREGVELYEIRFTASDPPAEADTVEARGGGTLVVTDSDDQALAEYERCEATGELFCFRAANVALYFDGALARADLARLAAALTALSEG